MECEAKLKCTSPEQRRLLAEAGFVNVYGLPIPQYEIPAYGGMINPTLYPLRDDLGHYDILGANLPMYYVIVPDVIQKDEIWLAFISRDDKQTYLFRALTGQLCPKGKGVSFKISEKWQTNSLALNILARAANPNAILP